jgi:hypothetical protein
MMLRFQALTMASTSWSSRSPSTIWRFMQVRHQRSFFCPVCPKKRDAGANTHRALVSVLPPLTPIILRPGMIHQLRAGSPPGSAGGQVIPSSEIKAKHKESPWRAGDSDAAGASFE